MIATNGFGAITRGANTAGPKQPVGVDGFSTHYFFGGDSMKVLLLAPDYTHAKSWTHEHFRQEIARQHEVRRHTGSGEKYVPLIVSDWCPDLILVGNLQFSVEYVGLDVLDIPKVAVVTDYFPRHYDYKNKILRRHDFDAVFFSQTQFVDAFYEFQRKGRVPAKTQAFWLPFSVDTKVYRGGVKAERPWDVTFIATDHPFEYPNRKRVVELLRSCEGNNFVRLVENPNGYECPTGALLHNKYAELLKKSKICVTSNDQHGCVNIKHLEFAAAGALVMTDRPKDFGAMGFVEGIHYAGYEDPEELPELLRHWLGAYEERFEIAREGQDLVMQSHNNQFRVGQLIARIIMAFGTCSVHVPAVDGENAPGDIDVQS